MPCLGALLRLVGVIKRVGYCAARLRNASAKRIGSDLLAWVGHGPWFIGRMQECGHTLCKTVHMYPWLTFCPRNPKNKIHFHLPSARVFREKTVYQKHVLELLKEFYPNRTV